MDSAALPEDAPRWSVEEETPNAELVSWPLEDTSCWVAPLGDTRDLLYTVGLPGQGTKTENQEDKEVETEPWTSQAAVNTDENWESSMTSVDDCSVQLSQRYEALRKEQEVDQVNNESQIKLLELKKEDALRQQQALINRMESLQIKLKLNCYKTTRKNFGVKKAELTAERDRLKEDANRLSSELENADKKLASLVQEQTEERETLQREIADLHRELNRLRKEYEEASQVALKDEIAAVEMQREASVSQVEEWLANAQQYLDMLRRSDASHQNMQHRLEWEKKIAAVRSSLGDLQRSYNGQLLVLRQGEQLDSLAPVALPSLSHIPLLELQMGLPASFAPPAFVPPPGIAAPSRFPSAAVGSAHARSTSKSRTPARHPVASAVPHATLLNKLNTPSRSLSPGKPAPVAQSAPAPADTAQPAGLLDKLLEKLGARFPQCSRNQLMSALQQIKSARGTMAGLSIEELTQQVAQRLAQAEKPALGPIGPPQHAQRPARPTQGSAAAHVFDIRTSQNATPGGRKLCLMCQNQVEAGTQHSMSCSHIVHKECISLWLQSSKNNSCPFCPSK